jgi:5,10-methylenetetrahydrofolate reductase
MSVNSGVRHTLKKGAALVGTAGLFAGIMYVASNKTRRDMRAIVHVKVSEEIKEEAQIKAIRERTTLTDAVEQLLSMWVRGDVELPQVQAEPA